MRNYDKELIDQELERLEDIIDEEVKKMRELAKDNQEQIEVNTHNFDYGDIEFYCEKHGTVNKVYQSGYALGHDTRRDGPNELDLEGIDFIFKVLNLPGSYDEKNDEVIQSKKQIELELIDADNAKSYLSKFSNWEEKITKAAEKQFEYFCPHKNCQRILDYKPSTN